MTLTEALNRANPDSQEVRWAFGMKGSGLHHWRAISHEESWTEIQIKGARDDKWIALMRVPPGDLQFVDPEVIWWPS